jgi:hypothetical protein
MISKDENVKKVATDLCPLYAEYGSCEACDAELDIDDEPCLYECMAKLVISKGYKKVGSIDNEQR